jgi:hypothetical protein
MPARMVPPKAAMLFTNLPGPAGVSLGDKDIEVLIARYAAQARELAQTAAIYTQVVDDLKRLVGRSGAIRPDATIGHGVTSTPKPNARHQARAAIMRSESSAAIDATAGDGYDPSADARSVAAMLRTKGGTQ